MKHIVTLSLLFLYSATRVHAQNLVPNPQFELARPSSKTYQYQNPQIEKFQAGCLENLARLTQCQNWTIWLGTAANQFGIMTETVKASSNCVPPWPNFVMGNMMHVKTTGGGMGIVNSDIPAGNTPVRISCWVYVVKGKVDFAYGPTGTGIVRSYSATTCKWEKLEMIKKGTEACNQVTVYSVGGDAEFYIDAVSVQKL